MSVRVGGHWATENEVYRADVLRQRDLAEEEVKSRPSVAEWYAGRNVFVTGASGFLGRVLVEFLLRCCPDIGKVYVVLRARKGVPPSERLPVLLGVPLFDRLRAEQPDALSKVVALSGDVEQLSLGLSEDDRRLICAEVSVVFHVAASVRFDDPFRKAVFTNLRSSREVVTLAKNMPQLKALVHVSTAYCYINQSPIEEKVYPNALDWREVIRWAEEVPDQDQPAIDSLGDKVRGFQPNTYTFTKALAEKVMEDASSDLPVVIIRPSIVVGSVEDPIPGWMDNLNGLCGFWVGSLKGVLRVTLNKPIILDSVPVDICTKMILLASWTKGQGVRLCEDKVDVVNGTVGNMVGVSFEEFTLITTHEEYRREVTFPGVVRPPHFRSVSCIFQYALIVFYEHIVFGVVMDTLAKMVGAKPRLMDIYRKVSVALHATAPFRIQCHFVMDNQRLLQIMMHPKDAKNLDYTNVYHIRDTMDTYKKTAVENLRGILKYVIREEDNPKENYRHLVRVKWLMRGYHTVMLLLAAGIVYALYLLQPLRNKQED